MTLFFTCLLFSFYYTTTAQIPSYVPTNGLVGYWPFNGNANDVSGNGNNGLVNGATLTSDRFGNVNGAFSFNGINNFISLGLFNNPVLSNTSLTISTWVKTITNNPEMVIIGCRGSGPTALVIQLNSQITCTYANNGGGFHNLDLYNINIKNNNWHHLVMLKNESGMKLFIDNVLMAESIFSFQLLVNGLLEFGRDYPYGRYYCGELDDISIHNRALTTTEITQLYTSTSTPTTPEDTTSNVGIGTVTPKRKLHINDVMRLEPRNTAPLNPAKGDIYFDGVLNKLRVYDGTVWQNCW